MRPSRGLLACVAASFLAGLAYLNALANPFEYDDLRTIVGNSSLGDLSNLRAIIWHDLTRPLVNLSYAIDQRLWGTQPFGFHLTSVLLHMLNVALLFRVTREWIEDGNQRASTHGAALSNPVVGAFAAAAVFGLHPMMTQAVGYISGRSEVLCATWLLLAMLAARRVLRGGSVAWAGASVLCWLLALLSKETAVMLPVVLVAYDWQLLDQETNARRRRWWMVHLPMWSIAVLGAAVRLFILLNVEQQSGFAIRWIVLLDAAVAFWRYVGLLLLPVGQSIFHEMVPVATLFDRRAMASVLGLAAVVVLLRRTRRSAPVASLGAWWFIVLMLPACALIVLDPHGDFSEHRVYIGSAGLCLLLGAMFGRLARSLESRSAGWIAPAILVAVLLPLSGRTLLRNAVWSNPVTLWSEAVEAAPESALPRRVLGESLHAAGRHEEAVRAFREAIDKGPTDGPTYMNLGLCLAELERFEEATAVFERLRALEPTSPIVPSGLGVVAMMSGHPDEARQHFQDAMNRDPRDLVSRQWLATLEESIADDPAAALRLCQQLQRLEPQQPVHEECIRRNRARLEQR